jgi:thiosulfate reductase/polysulfide reductase chain A
MEQRRGSVDAPTEVKRSICAMCAYNCGILAYTKNGKIIKIAGNPDNPVSRGYTCKRIASAIHWLYHTDQLKYPLKRVGPRGGGKWARITYEEALDEIAEKLKELKERYGAHTLAVSEGTLRYAEYWMRARFMNLFGSPNSFHPGVVCGLNREVLGAAIAGFRVCPKGSNLEQTKCVVLQASNPRGFSPALAEQIRRIRALRPGKLRVLAIDPRDTGIADSDTDIHLMIRPGTDAALLLGWLNVIINEKIYDEEFVRKHTFGFEKLAQRVQEYSPRTVAGVTGIPEDRVMESARIFGTSKPAIILGGVGTDQIGFNATRVEQAAACLMAVTGNLDIPGGRLIPMYPGVEIDGKRPLRDSELELTEKLPKEQRRRQIGGEKFRLTGYSGYEAWAPNYLKTYGIPAPTMHTLSANEPMIYRGIIKNDPDHIRALISWASNLLVRTGNTKLVYEALTSQNLELSVVLDLTLTPSAQVADYVIPSASCFERPYWTTWEDFSDVCCFGEQAIEPMGERKDDFYFWRGLGIRLGQEEYWPWKTHEEVMEYRAKPIGYSFEKLTKCSGLAPAFNFRKYEKRGFATHTGKFELYSTVLEKLGYDPLPYYREPPESPITTPEVAKEYPLVLITGGRSIPQYHSEFHQLGTGMRERHIDPIADIHRTTAQQLGIRDGDWIYIETKRGRIKQKAHVTEGIRPEVVNCEASWWYPEMHGGTPCLHGLWEANANVLTVDDPDACDELVGGWVLRGLLCKVYRVR